MAKQLRGIRKALISLDHALQVASRLANSAPDGSRTVRIWGRTMKDGTERYDVLDLGEKPRRGEGWQVLYKVEREGED